MITLLISLQARDVTSIIDPLPNNEKVEDYDLIVAVACNSTHHLVAYVIPTELKIVIYDPFPIKECYEQMRNQLFNAMEDWVIANQRSSEQNWKSELLSYPPQRDSYNCATFVCLHIESFARGVTPKFQLNSCKLLRLLIKKELLNSTLEKRFLPPSIPTDTAAVAQRKESFPESQLSKKLTASNTEDCAASTPEYPGESYEM